MKQKHMHHRVISITAALVMAGVAMPLYAVNEQSDEGEPVPVAAPTAMAAVLITEVQTGAATASDEFIELYNQSSEPVNIGGWQVRYLNAAATDGATTNLVTTIQDAVVLPPRTHYVLHTPTLPLAAGVLGQQYDATLSSRDKVVALFAPNMTTCQAHVHDALAWGASTQGEGTAVAQTDSTADKHVYRYVNPEHDYTDTNNNTHDAGIGLATTSIATMGALNTQAPPNVQQESTGAVSPLSPVTVKGCSMPQPPEPPASAPPAPPAPPPVSPPVVVQPAEDEEESQDAPDKPVLPERNVGLYAPQLSELLPNPAKPQTDAADEFIELYNSNNAPFELSGFMLEVGTTTKKRYTFPQGTMLAPKGFQAFMSKDTKLTLTNTTGQVRLLDPFGATIDESEPYVSAKDGQSWLTADNVWQWTTVATPGAINVVKAPASAKKPTAEKTAVATSGATNVKSASTTSPAATGSPAEQPADEDGGFNPLHPGILALTGVLAVLYAVYEYRRDLANKFHQFRANRAARRSLGEKPEGR